jgi:hypothetical protein
MGDVRIYLVLFLSTVVHCSRKAEAAKHEVQDDLPKCRFIKNRYVL